MAEHLKVLWHILNTVDSEEFMVRPLHCRYTYEYHSRFGGYVYDHDGRLAKQDKTDKKVTIGQQVRERNRKTPKLDQVEGKGEEKCGEPGPIFTNHEGDVQIMALTGRRSSSRHEGKLLEPRHKPKRRKESDFHQAAVSNSSGKSGPNPVGFSKWGQTLPAGSISGYSTLTVLGGSATKRTQARDEGAHSLLVKRGEPNPSDVQAANLNRLALHKAKVESRMIKKHPQERGILKLSLYEQRGVF